MLEIFSAFYSGGYDKYILDIGSNTGFTPILRLVESYGNQHLSKISLGQAYDLASSYGGYVNRALPIYLDTKYYTRVIVRLTYVHTKVSSVVQESQIAIQTNPSPVSITDFTIATIPNVDLASRGILAVSGAGNHYISEGNLGLGTTTPKERLSVNGKIRAHEIKVESDPATWPDYVFKSDYQLPSLDSVKKFVDQNHHLPNVPNAEYIAENGIALGEMNKILLQKIEELTLYVYDLQKRDEHRELAFKRLEDSVNQYKKEVGYVKK